MLKVSARVLGGRESRNGWRWLLPKFVGKRRSGRAFGPTWIQWILCVFTNSVHGVKCTREVRAAWRAFFLVQKEPATVPVSETFSPFFNADICTPLSSADVLKKCPLIALHVIKEEMVMDVTSLVWGMNGNLGCPKSP